MNGQEQFRGDEPAIDDFPTLCSIPLRDEWFDDVERPSAVIVRGTD